MKGENKIQVGGSLSDDLAAFVQAWKRVEAGDGREERILSFESWEGRASSTAREPESERRLTR